MKKVLVLFGGVSSEHDVSCVSASYVVSNIPRDKYEVCPLGIPRRANGFSLRATFLFCRRING